MENERRCGNCAARCSEGICRAPFRVKVPIGITFDRKKMGDDAGEGCLFWTSDPILYKPDQKIGNVP